MIKIPFTSQNKNPEEAKHFATVRKRKFFNNYKDPESFYLIDRFNKGGYESINNTLVFRQGGETLRREQNYSEEVAVVAHKLGRHSLRFSINELHLLTTGGSHE